ERFGLPPGDKKLRLGIAQDIRLALGILSDAVSAKGRVDRDRNSACEQDACEREEKLGACGQHDRDGLGGFEPAAAQFIRYRRRPLVELAESDRARLVALLVQHDVRSARLTAASPTHDFGER